MRILRDTWRVARAAGGISAWILATVWLGGRVLARWWVIADQSHRFLAETARCGRGHRVPLYGTFQCSSCHAVLEGYVFRPCRFCGSTPSWTPCPRCRLAVPNPLR